MLTRVTLPGSQKHLLPNSRPAGPVDPSEIASVTVRVRSTANPKDLEALAYKLAEQPLAKRKYLTREELGTRFGASASDLDAIEAFAQKHNLVISHRSAAKRSIVLTGKIGDLLSAFPTDLQMYHHALGTYRGRRGDISIPSDLEGIITGIFGFDTRPKHRSPFRAKAQSLAGPGGKNGVAASEFATRYKFPTTQGKTALDGSGQTIAIIELGGGYRASDLEIFFHEIGTSKPNVVAVSA